MKNARSTFYGVLVTTMFAFLFYSCNGEAKKPREEDKSEVLAPAQIVEIPQAKSMYDHYTVRRVPLIQRYEDSINRGRGYDKIQLQDQNKAANQEDSAPKPFDVGRFVYYDYETIKQYMAYIEQEAEAAGVEISTLRFYYSNYPDEAFFPNTKDSIKHPRQNSIMLSPTYNDGKRETLFYVVRGAEGPEAIPLNDDFGEFKGLGHSSKAGTKSYASFLPSLTGTKANVTYSLQGGGSLTMNRGSGVPPYSEQ